MSLDERAKLWERWKNWEYTLSPLSGIIQNEVEVSTKELKEWLRMSIDLRSKLTTLIEDTANYIRKT